MREKVLQYIMEELYESEEINPKSLHLALGVLLELLEEYDLVCDWENYTENDLKI